MKSLQQRESVNPRCPYSGRPNEATSSRRLDNARSTSRWISHTSDKMGCIDCVDPSSLPGGHDNWRLSLVLAPAARCELKRQLPEWCVERAPVSGQPFQRLWKQSPAVVGVVCKVA
jgi:hypothetical protein